MRITAIDKGNRAGQNILFCLVISAAFLAIGSRSSPLYPTNDWVDANAFLTMGTGMMHGLVPYRDLFEQKGPLLYFLHGLASLVSSRSFFGVYLLETISFTAFLAIAGKWIMTSFSAEETALGERRATSQTALMALQILLAFVIINAYAFALGDSAEELCLPLFAGGLYLLMRRFRDGGGGPDSIAGRAGMGGVFVAGILAGCVLWIKFSLLGFWLGWILAVLLQLAFHRRFRQVFVASVVFLGGMLAASLPWLLYFGFHGALGDLVSGYFLTNILTYPNEYPLLFRPFIVVGLVVFNASQNLLLVLLIIAGLIHLFHEIRTGRVGKVPVLRAMLLCLGILAVGVYGGARSYLYYFLAFAPFAIPGSIQLLPLLERLILRFPLRRVGKQTAAVLTILVLLGVSYLYNPNTYAMTVRQEDRAQAKFARIICSTPDPSLLNYGYLDHGFYHAAGLLPEVRFFEQQNLTYENFPLNKDEQNRYIRERLVTFVVIRVNPNDPGEPDVPDLLINYKLVAEDVQGYREDVYRYMLFELRKET